MDVWINRWMCGQMDRSVDGYANVWMADWIDGVIDMWIDVCMDGWILKGIPKCVRITLQC